MTEPSFAPSGSTEAEPAPPFLSLADAIREHLTKVYEASGRNKVKTALWLKIPRSTLYFRLRQYGVK